MKLMGVIFLGLIFSMLLFSCGTSRSATKSRWRSIYIDQFKLSYLRSLLIKSYNNSQAVDEIIELDHSGFMEPVLTVDDYKLIDSLTNKDNEKMKLDSLEGDLRAEGAEGKRPLQYIMRTFSDKSIEKLARRRFKHSGLLD